MAAALLGLFDRKQSRYLQEAGASGARLQRRLRRILGVARPSKQLPVLGWSATAIIPFLVPIFLVASVFYGIKVWHGDEVRVPLISDWIDDRLPAD